LAFRRGVDVFEDDTDNNLLLYRRIEPTPTHTPHTDKPLPQKKSKKMSLTPDQKAAAMMQGRKTLIAILDSAQQNNVKALSEALENQCVIVEADKTEEQALFETATAFEDGRERNALHFAALGKAEDSAKYLLKLSESQKKRKEFLNRQDMDGMTPLHLACEGGDCNIVSLLLKDKDVNMNLRTKRDVNVLHSAAMGGNSNVLRALYECKKRKVSLDDVAEAGTTLHFATDSKMMETLLSLGANPDAKDRRGISVMITAVVRGDVKIVSTLLKAGADIGVRIPEGGPSALSIVAEMGSKSVLNTILQDSKPDLLRNAAENRDGNNKCPAEIAAQSGHGEIANMLISVTPSLSKTELKIQKPQQIEQEPKIKTPAAKDVVRATELKRQGNEKFVMKKYEEAVKLYTEGLKFMPSHAQILNNRANAFHKLGRLEDSLKDALLAIESSPNWGKAHYRAGQVLLEMKNYTQAAEHLWKAYNSDKKKSKTILKMFSKAVALGKRKHQGKTLGGDDAESKDEVKYDHVVEIQVPKSQDCPDEIVTLPLGYNNDDLPAEAAGRFVDKFNLDRSLIPRVAKNIHDRMKVENGEE